MIKLNPRISVLIFILGFVSGCCFTYFVSGKSGNKLDKNHIVKPVDLAKQTKKTEEGYQVKITELENRNDSLLHELTRSLRSLNSIRANARRKAATIKRIIHPEGYPAKDLLRKMTAPVMASERNLSPCDSIIQVVGDYIDDNETKDSLCENSLVILDSVIIIKDSIISVQSIQQNALKKSFVLAIEQQKILLHENKVLRRQSKRQKVKSRLIALGAAIMAGVTANYLVHH